MSLIISLLVFIIVAGVLWWAANSLLGAFAVPEPIRTVVLVLIILILLLVLLGYVGVLPGAALGFHGGCR